MKIPTMIGGALAAAIISMICAGCGSHGRANSANTGGPISFTDISAKAGINFQRINGATGKKWLPETMGGGGGFIDYDNDGWQDIILLNGDFYPGSPRDRVAAAPPHPLALYHNNHDGTFTDVTKQAGLDVTVNAMGVAVGDYDNDGYDDLFITAIGGSHLYHNVPDGKGGRKFVDVTTASGIKDDGWPTSAAWVDYDRDGRLDLFVCHYLQWSIAADVYCGTTAKMYCGPMVYKGEPSRLYHNEGDGRFTDVTRKAGVYNTVSKGLGICVRDLDGDGWPDLIVTNDTAPNCVYHNNQHGGFDEIGVQSGIALSSSGTGRAGMGVDTADYLHKAITGLAIGNFSMEGLAFYDIPVSDAMLATERSQQNGLYAPSYPLLSFGLFFADFDNDGWPDLLVTNGHIESDISRIMPQEKFAQPNLVFRNLGNGTFADSSASAGTGITYPMVGRAACRGDFENNGKIGALLIPNIGPARLLKNVSPNQNHWITLKLVGSKSNRDGYGSNVTIKCGEVQQSTYSASGSSYLSANDNRLHFGLGAATTVDTISVRWPSGATEVWPNQPADRILTLTEGKAPAVQ